MTDFSHPIQSGYTDVQSTSDLNQREASRKDYKNLWATTKLSGLVTGSYFGLRWANDTYSIKNTSYFTMLDFAAKVPKGDGTSTHHRKFSFYKSRSYTPGDYLLEGIRKVEEYSPFQLARTFQLGHLMTPTLSSQKGSFFISPEDIISQKDYIGKLLEKEGNRKLDTEILNQGLFFKDNKLYIAKSNTTADMSKLVLNEARVVFPFFKVPKLNEDGKVVDDIYMNKIFRNYARQYGAEINVDEFMKEKRIPLSIIGGKSAANMNFQYGVRAYARTSFQIGAKALDEGFDALQGWLPEENLVGNWAHKWLKSLKTDLGTGGDYTGGVRHTVGKMAKNWASVVALGGLAYWGMDAIVSSLAPDDSYFKNGISSGLVGVYANSRIKYAQVVSDHTQGWRDAQENVAPGSTSLFTLAGLPASFLLAGRMASYSKRLYDANTKGYIESVRAATQKAPAFGKLLPNLFKGDRSTRWGLVGAAIGLALEAPFIPGALLTGDTSEELKAEYSGQKEVAVKANRWWLTGGSPWEGGKIKYYRPSQAYLWMNDIKTKSLYGDRETRRDMNPWLHPLEYLRDPYRLEKMTDEERPYPIWGMDVSSGSFLGKIFEKTVGALIKPDKLNPKALDYLEPQEGGTFAYKQKETKTQADLVAEGKVLPPQNVGTDYNTEAAKWSYRALKEFLGIRGFALDQIQDALGFDILDQDNQRLARSGEMSDIARDLSELNIGDIGGFGEIQRRAILTNAGALQKRFNPLSNKMPSWLPGDESGFYIDFQHGDPYRKIDEGDARLPGKGYEAMHPELQGLDPENYPDIYKYKILSDVALGSKEFYALKRRETIRFNKGLMSDVEERVYAEIKKQEESRSQAKQFYEPEDYKGITGKWWQFLTHDLSELPYEKLTPFRPTSKFVHQRSAIEDYESTQLDAGDAAIWEKPIEHFLSPAFTQTVRDLGVDYRPEKTKERYDVDEYFDKLQYYKYRQLYKSALNEGDKVKANEYKRSYQKTIEGVSTSDMTKSSDALHAFIALPKRERDYFGAFVNAKEEDRSKIEKLLPKRISAIYEELWKRKDVRDQAYDEKTGTIDQEKLQRLENAQIQEENQELAEKHVTEYNTWKNSKKLQSQGTFKEYIADLDSAQYIAQTTGIPDKNFIGWDPRIDLKEVKLKTLSIGGDDLYEYGFYKSDLQALRSQIAVMQDQQVSNSLDAIKDKTKRRKAVEFEVQQKLIQNDIRPEMVQVLPTSSPGTEINVDLKQDG